MAGEGESYQNRIADLLDDITVGTASVSPTPTDGAVSSQNGTPASLPIGASPAASPAPTSLPPVAPPLAGGTPAASGSTTRKDDAGSLPPFLRQPAADPEQGSTLPGTALFASAAKASTPRAEQPTAQPPVPPTNGEPTPKTALPPVTAADEAPPAATQPDVPVVPAAAVSADETADGGASAEAIAASMEAIPAEAATPAGPPISIKGRSDGLVIEIGKGSWSEILATLDERLQQSASFFRNARVAVDLGARATTEAELKPLADLLKTHGLCWRQYAPALSAPFKRRWPWA